jgi:hypothetical protein
VKARLSRSVGRQSRLDYLFRAEPSYEDYDKLIISVMMTAKERYPQAKKTLITLMNELIALFTTDLQSAYPDADEQRCRQVAYSILCTAFANESLVLIGMDAIYSKAARQSAEALLNTLR